MRFVQYASHQRAARNVNPKSPCCLPHDRQSPPCCPMVASGVQLFDLHGIMADQTGDFRPRIEFSPCSQGGAGSGHLMVRLDATAISVASLPGPPTTDRPIGNLSTVAPGMLTCGTPVNPP